MPYTVNPFDTNNADTYEVIDQTINTQTHVSLVGKNFFNYGEIIAENFLHMLENFASTEAPSIDKAVVGQIYYNKNSQTFFQCNLRGQDKVWESLGLGTVRPLTLLDVDGENQHTVTALYDELNLIAVVSSEDFDINSSDPNYPTFDANIGTHIKAGITLKEGLMFHGTATSAQYADLAELYTADAEYEPGTVLKIGGEAEVTQTTDAFCPEVFGIVSTNPAYLMNSACEGTSVAIALEGRVPCKVIGPVKKGQRLVASEQPGVARAVTDYETQESMDWYRIVGRSLEEKTTEGIGLVEVVVGAK